MRWNPLDSTCSREAPDELVRVKPHRGPALGAADAIVLPAERNRLVVGCNEADGLKTLWFKGRITKLWFGLLISLQDIEGLVS